jgi:Protein of unknown function (DUF2442)
MEQSIHPKSKSRLQKGKNKNKADEKIAVTTAVYLKDFEILIHFTNGEQRIVNFLPLFSKLSGAYIKYSLPENFKKFIVKNGNIYWGKNEDVIFPVAGFYTSSFSKKPKEEILYVI